MDAAEGIGHDPPAPHNQAQPPPDRPFIFEGATPLEDVPQLELNNSGIQCTGDPPKLRRTNIAGRIAWGNGELGVIEQVKELGAKFELMRLADPRVLEQPEIPVVDPRSMEDVTPKIPEPPRATGKALA